MKKLSLTLIMSLFTIAIFSNDIQLSNASLLGQDVANQTVQVKFDITWDNSWRTSTAVPLNWDAAWVFIKYRVGLGEWHHAKISTTGYVEPVTNIKIDVATDSTGAFIHLANDGWGSPNWQDVQLQWAYGANGVGDDDQVEIKVFAIEMVYIPAGPFYLGDGLVEVGRGQFHDGSSTNPFHVTTNASLPCGTGTGQLNANNHFLPSGDIPAIYPKGFNAFYCMKYEISQEQYVEFLNTLTREQQNYHTNTDISGTTVTNPFVMGNTMVPQWGNGIRCDLTLPATGPIEFYMDLDNDDIMNEASDGQNRACTHPGWPHLAAYLDWAALRPMSELEYEKLCRGPKYPVPGEFAWGTTAIHSSPYTLTNSGYFNESISDPGTNAGNALYNSTRGSNAIFRCGIFAASAVNSSRQESGAGYYGCMELCGSIEEQVVRAGYAGGRSYTGLHGDGELNTAGHSDTDYWPGMGGNINHSVANGAYDPLTGIGVTGNSGIGYAGGFSNTSVLSELRTSDRYRRGFSTNGFGYNVGGRGCRTAD